MCCISSLEMYTVGFSLRLQVERSVQAHWTVTQRTDGDNHGG